MRGMRIVAVVAGMLIAGVSIAGCSSGDSGTASESASTPSSAVPTESGTPQNEYSAATQEQFNSECVQTATQGGTPAESAKVTCGCTYRGIVNQIPYEQFASEDVTTDEQFQAKITQIKDECLKNPTAY